MNLEELFKTDNKERDNFLSRVFGIFSEEIVKFWCANSKSEYEDLGRPSLYFKETSKYTYTTLDFSLKDKDGNIYVAEQKCELAYQNYKFLELNNIKQLKHHEKKKAFKRFLDLAQVPDKYEVRINKNKEQIKGSILIWGKLSEDSDKFNKIKADKGLHEILSIENMINDLIVWEDKDYFNFLDVKDCWFKDMINNMKCSEKLYK